MDRVGEPLLEPRTPPVNGSLLPDLSGPGDRGRGRYSDEGHLSRDGRTIRGADGVTGRDSSFMFGSPLAGDGDLVAPGSIIVSCERRPTGECSREVKPLK